MTQPDFMIKYRDAPDIIFSHKHLNTSEKRFQMSMALSFIVILICRCVYLLIVSICHFVIYLKSLLLSTIEFMILEFVDLISIVLQIPLMLIRECINLINLICEFLIMLCRFFLVIGFVTILVHFHNQKQCTTAS